MLSNFIVIRNLIPWRSTIMYIDVPQYYADEKFLATGARVHFKREASHSDWPFVLVFCSFNNKYTPQVAEVMNQLNNLLILKEGTEYLNFKEQLNKVLKGALEEKENENE